ncbi:MAG: O-antigen ligase family protein [Microgenomates group bacterium]|jgi:O-antigen ligase
MSQKILTYSFYILFFFTPLFWTPYNFELFEYNKMMLVYLLTTLVSTVWVWEMIKRKSLILKSTPLDIPILLFLGANILSTVFSIDPHVSWWGYYSRSNGGLLSIISYTVLYYALVSNFSSTDAIKFLKAAVFGGVIVALYAIPEHFGVSPSCVILNQQLTDACWVQDVQARVFATLGQPNWLAAYLAMLIFPALYFLLTNTKKSFLSLYSLILILFYMAFTFTYSRGATLGLLGGLVVFCYFQLSPYFNQFVTRFKNFDFSFKKIKLNSFIYILISFVIINILFGSALTSFKLLSKFAPPPRGGLITQAPVVTGTQLENGGTESGVIRLIVWKGAIQIFLHNPILGTGVETFAYSYYNFRPVEHNLVSEWDFLYNKAHNEFLNYLANTGAVGFLAYLGLILTFIYWSVKKIIFSKSDKLILIVILASIISYHIQDFFGFSVVIVAVFFYLFPAIAFITTDSTKPFVFPKKLSPLPLIFHPLLYKKRTYTNIAQIAIIIISGLTIVTLLRFYWADTYFASGNNANEAGNPGRAYNQLTQAVALNPGEPYYLSEISYAAAASAVAIQEEDATISARLKDEAIADTEKVLTISPKNVSFYRTAIRTYYLISTIDPSYKEKTLQVLNTTISLAPTDAKLIYNKAIILGQNENNKEAILNLEKAVALKPNYRDAFYTLGLFYFDDGQKDQAIVTMKKVLQLIPGDSEATEKLKEWDGN